MKSPVQGNTGPQRGNEQTDKSCKVTLGPDWKGSQCEAKRREEQLVGCVPTY